jgi:hypothetical protein
MKYTVTLNRLQVIGRIWMPNVVCAQSFDLDNYHMQIIEDYGDGQVTRAGVALWLDTHAGDFQEIIDFSADFGDNEFVSDWENEDSEYTFYGCMYGEEE